MGGTALLRHTYKYAGVQNKVTQKTMGQISRPIVFWVTVYFAKPLFCSVYSHS